MMRSKTMTSINGVIVKIKKERYMVEVNKVKEIYIPGEKIIPIPLANKSVVGVIDIRGIIFTIISLRHIINPNEANYAFSNSSRVLLLETNGMNVGILVDSVVGVSEVPLSIFDNKNTIIETSIDWAYVKSIGVLEGQSIILLDIDSLISKPEGQIEEELFMKEIELTPPPEIKSDSQATTKPSKSIVRVQPLKRMTAQKQEIKKDLKVLKFTDAQKDMLMEVGNIGTGNAVTALSKMINKRIDVDFTDVNIIKFDNMASQFGGGKEFVCGIFSHIEEPSQSTLLQVFEMNPLIELIKTLEGMKKKKLGNIKSRDDLDDYTISTIKELGNIMAGHYASALADLMHTKIVPFVPDFAMTQVESLSNFLADELQSISDYIVMIKTIIRIVDLQIKGIFFFIPDFDALQDLFKVLGLEQQKLARLDGGNKKQEIQVKIELNPQQKDALQEVGNIGSGNAANALAKMINQRVDIDIPSVEMLKLEDFAKNWEKSGKLFLCWSNVTGIANATVITTFQIKDMIDIISLVVGEEMKIDPKKIKGFNDFPELYKSAMTEVGHILASHYTSALGNLLSIKLMIDPPDVNVDTGKELIKILKDDLGLISELSLVITTQILIKDRKVQGSFLFIPNLDKLKELLGALSAFYEST